MTYQIGSTGAVVKQIQAIVGCKQDGVYGTVTEQYVRIYQASHGLKTDGIVGAITLQSMGLLNACNNCFPNATHYMPSSEYFRGPVPKNWVIWHHTAGWDNPYATIDMWANDRRAKVGTEFVIGGQHPLTNSDEFDGQIVQAFPEGGYAWHTATGISDMHIQSVGIELCNIGPIIGGKTYVGTDVSRQQIYSLDKAFRGTAQYQRYSDKQLQSLKTLTLHLADKYNIDLHEGLYKWVKSKGIAGWDSVNLSYANTKKGLYTHANLTSQKSDCFPQAELIDLLLSL